jgi:hypothetical protein
MNYDSTTIILISGYSLPCSYYSITHVEIYEIEHSKLDMSFNGNN